VAKEPVTSAPPTLADYLGAIEDDSFDQALVITPATELANMHYVASVAASISRRPVEVVDTRSFGAAHCLVVAAALEALVSGAGAVAASEAARSVADRTELVAALPEFGSMHRFAAVASDHSAPQARRHPLVRLRGGSVLPFSGALSESDALAGLETAWLEGGGSHAGPTLIFHAGAELLAERLQTLLGPAAEIVPCSPALAIQTGLGCVGAAWTRRS
jgi:fatty acid-binding protein DegV